MWLKSSPGLSGTFVGAASARPRPAAPAATASWRRRHPGLGSRVLNTCPDYAGADLVEGLLERKVDLRTPGRPGQTDLLAFVKSVHAYAVIAVEGKVDESFGARVSTWNDHSPARSVVWKLFACLSGFASATWEESGSSFSTVRSQPCTRLKGIGRRGRSC